MWFSERNLYDERWTSSLQFSDAVVKWSWWFRAIRLTRLDWWAGLPTLWNPHIDRLITDKRLPFMSARRDWSKRLINSIFDSRKQEHQFLKFVLYMYYAKCNSFIKQVQGACGLVVWYLFSKAVHSVLLNIEVVRRSIRRKSSFFFAFFCRCCPTPFPHRSDIQVSIFTPLVSSIYQACHLFFFSFYFELRICGCWVTSHVWFSSSRSLDSGATLRSSISMSKFGYLYKQLLWTINIDAST